MSVGFDPAIVADHPVFVFGAYFSAFAPLTIIYALDLVSEKWRTVKETRRAGYFILLFSIPSLLFLFVYIHFQRRAEDFKEMAAATSAAVYSVLHVFRTVWGLIQLTAFQRWNQNALIHLKWLGYDVIGHKETSESLKRKCRADCKLRDTGHELKYEETHRDGDDFPEITQNTRTIQNSQSIETSRRNSKEDGTISQRPSSAMSETVRDRFMSYYKSSKKKLKTIRKTITNLVIVEDSETSICEDCHVLEKVEDTIENDMVVNSSLIDNEFAHAELPCQLDFWPFIAELRKKKMQFWKIWASEFLKCKLPEECTVQWIVAFLSRFGSAWLVDSKNTNMQHDLAILSALHVTHKVPVYSDSDNDRSEHESVLPPGHSFSINRREIQSSSLEINEEVKESLPYKMRGCRKIKSMDFAAYESNIRDAIASWHTASVNKLEKKAREAVLKIEPYQAAMFAKLISGNSRNKIAFEKIDDDLVPAFAFKNFNTQLGNMQNGSKNVLEYLPFRKEFSSVLLWNGESRNRFLLQGSLHIDNWLALEIGHRQQNLFMNTSNAFRTMVCTSDVLTFQKGLEIYRLQNDLAMAHDMEQISPFHRAQFLGCVAESVRSLLAKWIIYRASNNSRHDHWTPWISDSKINMFCSRQLCDAVKKQSEFKGSICVEEKRNIDMRILWEIQSFLHERVSDIIDSEEEVSLPGCTLLIMMFISGFPAVNIQSIQDKIEITIDDANTNVKLTDHSVFQISAVEGPQDISIILKCDTSSGNSEILLSYADNYENTAQFKWQEWKDAVYGRILAQSDWRESKLFSKTEKFRKETFSCEITESVRTIYKKQLDLDYDVTIWTGWPPHLCQIAQFEIIESFELRKEECYQMILDDSQDIVARLERAMDRIRDSGKVIESGKSLYLEAVAFEQAGNKKQWEAYLLRCVAEYAHSDALDDAVSHIFGGGALKKSSLLTAIYEGIGVYLKARTKQSKFLYSLFQLEKVADYCDQIYLLPSDSPENFALFLKGLAFFYSKEFHEGIDNRCIDAFESSLFYRSDCSFYLAMSYYRLYQINRKIEYKQMATKYVKSYKSAGTFKTSMAYLLEKGSFSSKNCERLKTLCDYFRAFIDGGQLKDLFYFLFLKPGASGIILPSSKRDEILIVREDSIEENSPVCGIYQDTQRAVKMYKIAVRMYKSMSLRDFTEEQNPLNFGGDASNRLAMIYHRGPEFSQDFYSAMKTTFSMKEPLTKAEKLYLEAIEMSNIDAYCNLGVLYMDYKRGAQDVFRAVEKLENAIQKLNTTAMNNLAVLIENRSVGLTDNARVRQLYEKAIRVDRNAIAEYNLAVFLKFGDTAYRNVRRGNKLFDDILRRNDINHLPVVLAQATKARETAIYETEWAEDLPIIMEEIGNNFGYVKLVD